MTIKIGGVDIEELLEADGCLLTDNSTLEPEVESDGGYHDPYESYYCCRYNDSGGFRKIIRTKQEFQ